MREIIYPLSIIVAVDLQGGISKNNKIPWYFPDDLKYFKEITNNSTCIMGKNTFNEILEMKKTKDSELLPNRESIVLSKTDLTINSNCATIAQSLREATYKFTKNKIFIIGGEKLFIEALPNVNEIYMTIINNKFKCDKFFRIDYLKNFKVELISKMNHGINVRYYR